MHDHVRPAAGIPRPGQFTRRPRVAYTILDLLVVTGIIALLVSILLPALAKAREQGRYVRWQAFSRDMSMDENIAVQYTFQNDRGGTSLCNMAAANHDPTYLPNSMDLTLHDLSNGMATVTNPDMINYFWSADGRFKGKPAASFLNTGASNNMVVYPSRPDGSGMLARLLRKSQAITIAVWIKVPPVQSIYQFSSVVWWTDSRSNYRVINVHLPWGGQTVWDTYNAGPALANRLQTPFVYGQDSQWSLWCFTKDNHSGLQKIYLNGQLVAAAAADAGAYTWQDFDTSPISASDSWQGPSNFTFGSNIGYGSCAGTVDELAIFDADLSPPDVTPSGAMLPGVPAVRFLQMYQMGSN